MNFVLQFEYFIDKVLHAVDISTLKGQRGFKYRSDKDNH